MATKKEVWYERFGFRENPFDIFRTDFLIGEEEQIEYVKDIVKDQYSSLLYGNAGIGKSTLAKNLKSHLKEYNCIYVNCKKYAGDNFSFEKEFYRPAKGFLGLFNRKPIVVLLDEMHLLAPQMMNKITGYVDDREIKSVIGFQVEPSMPNCTDPIRKRFGANKREMKTPTTDIISQIINIRLNGEELFEEGSIEVISKKCNHNPREILFYCYRLCEKLNIQKGQKITKKDVARISPKNIFVQKDGSTPKIERETKIISKHDIADIKKKYKLSPMEILIAEAILVRDKATLKQITEDLGKAKKDMNSVGTRLSKMTRKKLLVKDNSTRPVIFMLENSFKNNIIGDK